MLSFFVKAYRTCHKDTCLKGRGDGVTQNTCFEVAECSMMRLRDDQYTGAIQYSSILMLTESVYYLLIEAASAQPCTQSVDIFAVRLVTVATATACHWQAGMCEILFVF